MKLDSAVLVSQPVSFGLWRTTRCCNRAELDRLPFRNELLSGNSTLSELSDNFVGMQAAPFQLEWSDPANTVLAFGDEQIVAERRVWTLRRARLVEIDNQTWFGHAGHRDLATLLLQSAVDETPCVVFVAHSLDQTHYGPSPTRLEISAQSL